MIGPTKEVASFVKLSKVLHAYNYSKYGTGCQWNHAIFLSESEQELEAAAKSGIGYPVLCRRTQMNKNIENSPYPVLKGLGLMALTSQN